VNNPGVKTMPASQQVVDGLAAALAPVAKQLGVVALYAYGSVLRADYQLGRSDIDILLVVDDHLDPDSFAGLATQVRSCVPGAETTLLRGAEVACGHHPGGSSHYFVNVARTGMLLHGPDVVAASARIPQWQATHRRITLLAQRARLTTTNPSKASEAGFWLGKYQQWVPLALMELLELAGTPISCPRQAHHRFAAAFLDAADPVRYPYSELASVGRFLEQLAAWMPGAADRFHQADVAELSAAGDSR